jgi:hypothetical protein
LASVIADAVPVFASVPGAVVVVVASRLAKLVEAAEDLTEASLVAACPVWAAVV